MKGTYILLILLLAGFGGYSQTASRLVGFSMYSGIDTLGPCFDSAAYFKYSMDRGGEMYSIPSKFSYGYPILNSYPFGSTTHDLVSNNPGLTKFDSAWKINPHGTQLSEQIFDEANNIIYTRKRLLIDNSSLRNFRSMSYKYDIHNHLTEEVDTVWSNYGSYGIYSVTFHQYQYDSIRNFISNITYSLEGSDTNSKYGYVYFYDNNGNLTDVCEQYWDKANHFMRTNRFTRFYYTLNRPDSFDVKDVFSYKNDTFPFFSGKYYFSPSNDTTIVEYYYWVSSLNILYHRVTNLYDAHHNKISMTMENLNSSVSNYKPDRFEYTYNNFDQVTSEKYYITNTAGTFTLNWLYRYFYETYIPGPPYVKNNLDIYPSPTKSDLTMKLLWQDAQPFAVCIYNSVGQRIMQWDEPAIKEYKKTITLPELASGNYFIQVNSGKQRIVKKFVIN
ncbi:MAG: Secretion system C-terminal sorting domain [Flavipsychrobacter sp.]|jgi:hypothetical protein|nr:Secretion system C-terminal sorting domain [Flavipsychrobacter sp.]